MKKLTLLLSCFLNTLEGQVDPPMDPPQPLPEVEHIQGQTYLFSWEGVPGRVYFIQTSSTLTSDEFDWEFAPDIRVGTGSQIEMGFQANASHFEFFRLVCYDYNGSIDPNLADFDNDGFTNLEEAIGNTNPFDDQYFPINNGGGNGNVINLDGGHVNKTSWVHPWEYKLTYTNNSGTSSKLVNPYHPTATYSYAMGEDISTEIVFENIDGLNRAAFIQIEPNLSYIPPDPDDPPDETTNNWNFIKFFELSNDNLKWNNPPSPGTEPEGFVLPWEIGVDNNRDGDLVLASIKDQTTLSKPYRFWLNNDNDTGWGADTYLANRDNPWLPGTLDNADDKINEVRDLEDFARIHFNVRGLQEFFKNGTMSLGFKWKSVQEGSPQIRLFTATENDGGTKYLSDVDESEKQQLESQSSLGTVQGSDTLYLPISFWYETAGKNTKNLIFEAIGEGKGALTMVLEQDGHVLGEGGSVFFDLLDIRKMYEQWGVSNAAIIPDPNVDETTYVSNVTPALFEYHDSQNGYYTFEPAWDEDLGDKNYTVCIHGWRKGGPAAGNFSQYYKGRSDEITMFKRLWHRGYKGRYIGFIWPTYDEEVYDEGGAYDGFESARQSKFNHSEFRAWKSGLALKMLVESLPSDYEVKIFAHSLGNVVVSSALEKGMAVDNYSLLNAAIPARCYHKNAPTTLSVLALLPPVANVDMSDDSTAHVRALSYRGDSVGSGFARLEQVTGNISNFYLPDDESLGILGWKANQALGTGAFGLSKPVWNYEYENVGLHEVQWDPFGPVMRVIWDPHEGMAMVNNSWSEAVGSAPVISGAGGKGIDNNINMNGPGMSFGTEHEAVFKWRFSRTWKFYSLLWDELELSGTKVP